ncbi:MAG TPA: PIG-L family deacetylase, partial [Verrucomicrobiae bacterium]|nr:PIG-L family deacetylase [Verrucomicrobiae bacterium]
MNPYKQFVLDFAAQVAEGKKLPLGGFDAPPRPVPPQNAPNALFFAPHPDDECISGGLALRLLREAGMNVINVAVTLGSKKERQRERWEELTAACHYLGFGLESTGPNGLEKINSRARQENPAQWSAAVQVIERLLQKYHPRVVFFPHQLDWNSTHIGTYLLVTDALSRMAAGFGCYVVETEFWGQMQNPNAMVEMSVEDVAAMIAATSFHAGEVRRNPYHLLL